MVAKNAIALFNLNGTLTIPGQGVPTVLLNYIFHLQEKIQIGIISTCTLKHISQKIGGADNLKKFDYVFSENGLVTMKRGKIVSEENIIDFLGEDCIKELINCCMEYLVTIEVPVKRGTFIDLRTGLVNISPIGHDCTIDEKNYFEAFDKIHGVRNNFINFLREVCYEELDYTLCGGTSFSVFPQGWDKSYCLKFLGKFAKVVFYGDKCKPGESDHYLHKDPRVQSIEITEGPDQVLYKLGLLFSRLHTTKRRRIV